MLSNMLLFFVRITTDGWLWLYLIVSYAGLFYDLKLTVVCQK